MFGLQGKIDKALTLYESGEYEKSLKLCQRILKSDSSHSCIWITAGNVYYMNKDYATAACYYQKALARTPDSFSGWINWSNCQSELKNYKKAIYGGRQALKLQPNNKIPYTILGNNYNALEKYPESIACFKQALKIDERDPWVYNYLSQSYQKNGNYIESLSCAWKAVELGDKDDNSHHINLGYLFYEIAMEKGVESIVDCVDLWVKKYGINPIVKYTSNALINNTQIKKADLGYVRDIFDIFAPDFEEVLTSLEYNAPNLIRDEMARIYGTKPKAKLRILDVGCGTGFCGEFLENYAAKKGLEGIDISKKMLKEAARKNKYSKLINGEILSYLKENNNPYDLMVAADVFTYFGELEDLFEYINKSLEESGRIIFTISENNHDKSRYFLHASGRFLHSKNYVEDVLKKSCFKIEKWDRKKLRNEGGKAVMGYLISAQKKI